MTSRIMQAAGALRPQLLETSSWPFRGPSGAVVHQTTNPPSDQGWSLPRSFCMSGQGSHTQVGTDAQYTESYSIPAGTSPLAPPPHLSSHGVSGLPSPEEPQRDLRTAPPHQGTHHWLLPTPLGMNTSAQLPALLLLTGPLFISLLVFHRKQPGQRRAEAGWVHRATVPCWGGSQPSGSAEGSAPGSQQVFSTLPFFLTTAGGLVPKKLATET